MKVASSIYYVDTLADLERDEYVSLQSQLAKFRNYPYFSSVHAHNEILRAIEDYYHGV